MTQNWPFAKITDILPKKLRSVIVSQNHYLNKILDIHPLWYFILKLGIFYPNKNWGLFPGSALPDSKIPNPQLDILYPTWDFTSPIRDNMFNWGYFLLLVY